jgi:RNA polymerase sigma factor (sigma-70 family)
VIPELLIENCLKGNKQAERQLFDALAPKVYTLCRRYFSCDSTAKDLLQECFIRLFEQLPKYDPKRGSFGAWSHRLCTNVVLQKIRKQKRSKIILIFQEELPETAVEEEVLDDLPKEDILAAVRELPDGYREVLNLSVFEKWSHRAIGKQLGISESTSRSQLSRAKKLLLSKFKQINPSAYERLVRKQIG